MTKALSAGAWGVITAKGVAMEKKPWSIEEEDFIVSNSGDMTVREIAEHLGRTYTGVRSHIQWMGYVGKLDKSVRVYGSDHWISNLRVCPECVTPRSSFGRDGVCSVCHRKRSLEEHERKMHLAYENLPRELKERTNGTFRIQRNERLMSKSKGLKEPCKPSLTGLDEFHRGKAMEEYHVAHEQWEMAKLTLDIDCIKQRRSKWLRKAAKWRKERGIG